MKNAFLPLGQAGSLSATVSLHSLILVVVAHSERVLGVGRCRPVDATRAAAPAIISGREFVHLLSERQRSRRLDCDYHPYGIAKVEAIRGAHAPL